LNPGTDLHNSLAFSLNFPEYFSGSSKTRRSTSSRFTFSFLARKGPYTVYIGFMLFYNLYVKHRHTFPSIISKIRQPRPKKSTGYEYRSFRITSGARFIQNYASQYTMMFQTHTHIAYGAHATFYRLIVNQFNGQAEIGNSDVAFNEVVENLIKINNITAKSQSISLQFASFKK